MLGKLKKLIRYVRITGSGDDSKQFPVQQVSYMGKTANVMMVFPYGMHGNVDKDSLGLMFQVLGDNGSKAAVPMSHKDRPALNTGEVVFFHPPTGTKIHLKKDGSIDIDAGNANIDLKTGSGDVTIESTTGNVTVKAPTGKINLESLQAEITSLTAAISGLTFITHVHTSAAPGSPTSGPIAPPPPP